MKKALITGVTGQDGSYLTEFLLEKGYEVHGMIRRNSIDNTERLTPVLSDATLNRNFHLHYGDLSDSANIFSLVQKTQPDEIYNLAAMSHVKVSFDNPEYTANVDGIGTLRFLEAIRLLGLAKKTRFYQASTSELYGKVVETPQKETTPFYPRSPYGIAKLYGYWITVNYREGYNLFAVNGILFNHESPRRGENFVTRKISLAAAAIKLGLKDKLVMGNLDAKRDWGYAKDYVEGMWKMLQVDTPEDFVLATGETHTVREFIEKAFAELDINVVWRGRGVEEKGYCAKTNKCLVEIDPHFFRPTEVELLLGDATKAREKLNWQNRTSFNDLVKLMVKSDLAFLDRSHPHLHTMNNSAQPLCISSL